MNQTQKNYIVKRVNEMSALKVSALRDQCTTKGVQLTTQEQLDLIYAKKVKIVPRKKLSKYSYSINVHNLFDFSKYETKQKFDQKRYTKSVSLITKEANRIKDEVMVGDSQKALELLEAFESFNV